MATKTVKTITLRAGQYPPDDSAYQTGAYGWSVSVLDDSGRTVGTRTVAAPAPRGAKTSGR